MSELKKVFARAAAKPEGPSRLDFVDAILDEDADLRKKVEKGELTAYFPGNEDNKYNGKGDPSGHFQGANSVVVFIGDLVYKGSNYYAPPMDGIDKEVETLRSLEGSGLPVPQVKCVGKKAAYYGMTRLPGIQLPEDFLDTFTPKEVERLADDLAEFMARLTEHLPAQPDGFRATISDLQPKNIVIDPETKRLSGIVDIAIRYSKHPEEMYLRNPRSMLDLKAFNLLIRENERVKKAFDPHSAIINAFEQQMGEMLLLKPAPATSADRLRHSHTIGLRRK